MTRAEQETIIRWDRTKPIAYLCTADSQEAARWRKKGYPVSVLGFAHGKPRSWQCEVPLRLIRLRPMSVLHQRPPQGRRFLPRSPREPPGETAMTPPGKGPA